MWSRFKVDAPMRLFLLVVAVLLWLGIWLTGFQAVHWVLYIPAVFFVFAALTGLCPGMFISRTIFKK